MGVHAYDDLLEWNIPDLSYVLPYRVNGDDVEILRFFQVFCKRIVKYTLANFSL